MNVKKVWKPLRAWNTWIAVDWCLFQRNNIFHRLKARLLLQWKKITKASKDVQYLLTVVRKTIFLCLFGKPQKIKLFCIVQNWHNVRNLQMSFRVNSNAIRLKFQNMRCTVLSYKLYHLPLTFAFFTPICDIF